MYIGKLDFGRLIQLPHTIILKKKKEMEGAIETRDQETRDQRPETKRPETRDQETRDQRPETRDQRPETRDQETRDQRPRDQRPRDQETRDQETRDQRPETIKYTLMQDVSFVYKRRTPLRKPLWGIDEVGVETLLQSRRV